MSIDNKVNTPQKRIQEQIDKGYMVTQCCVYGTFKDPLTQDYVGFRLDKPYNKISHGYSPEWFDNYMEVLKMDRRQDYKTRHEKNKGGDSL